MSTAFPERSLFEITKSLCDALAKALDSLGGKEKQDLLERFRHNTARHIHQTADGFCILKNSRSDYAASILVRSAMEAMFKLLAVKREPSCLRVIARYEWEQDKKLARGFGTAEEAINTEFDKRWQEFDVGCQLQFPEHSMPPLKSINAIAAANAANIEKHYETFYLVYCQFTHAALRASVGDLERLSGKDERVIGATLIVAIEAVLDCGGTSQELAHLRANFFDAASSSGTAQ